MILLFLFPLCFLYIYLFIYSENTRSIKHHVERIVCQYPLCQPGIQPKKHVHGGVKVHIDLLIRETWVFIGLLLMDLVLFSVYAKQKNWNLLLLV